MSLISGVLICYDRSSSLRAGFGGRGTGKGKRGKRKEDMLAAL